MKIFDSVGMSSPRRNKFNLSHERKMSMKMGTLTPCYLQEVLPGDKFRVNTEILMRLAPMISPVMHRVNVYTHYFFVPNRLVWNEWEDFITGGEDGTSAPLFPVVDPTSFASDFVKGSLADYLGLPVRTTETPLTTKFSALPFRAYTMIYNEYYRDQNVQPKAFMEKTSGNCTNTEMNSIQKLKKRAWEKDYFTSSLPWSQRGGEAEIPLGNIQGSQIKYSDSSNVKQRDGVGSTGNLEVNPAAPAFNLQAGGVDARIENIDSIDVNSTTINDLRKANQLQKWLEKSARGGSRYIEVIKSFFNVKSSDARLQRPEYLGGGKQPIVISEVLNSTGTQERPQGDMAGHGISVGSRNGFKRSFEEHGYVIGIVSVLPKTAYHQGVAKHWRRRDKFDFYWPEFANLGEQEVKLDELFYNYTTPDLETVFGYQQRYAEYKYNQSSVHGDMRDSLEHWHMSRKFATAPALNDTFIKANPTKRIFAVEDDNVDELFVQIYNKVDALRPMPYHSIPTL